MFRILPDITDRQVVSLTIDGVSVEAWAGEPVAAVLLRTSPNTAGVNAAGGDARAPYCFIGACFDCVASVDGVRGQRTCMISVAEGMQIERRGRIS